MKKYSAETLGDFQKEYMRSAEESFKKSIDEASNKIRSRVTKDMVKDFGMTEESAKVFVDEFLVVELVRNVR